MFWWPSPLTALMARNPKGRLETRDDVVIGRANQAGEDNRSVARIERPCWLSADDGLVHDDQLGLLGAAWSAIRAGDQDFMIAEGEESKSGAPFVRPKATNGLIRRLAQVEQPTSARSFQMAQRGCRLRW